MIQRIQVENLEFRVDFTDFLARMATQRSEYLYLIDKDVTRFKYLKKS